MADSIPTLRTVFSVTHDEATNAIIRGVNKKVWKDVALPNFLVQAAAGRVARTMDALLATPLSDILCGAWNSYRRYCRYADPKTFGEDHDNPEAHFTIESTHTPKVDLMINGAVRRAVSFPITVSLEFEGATVVVRDGKFIAIRTGSCTASGKVCCEKATLTERHSAPLALPAVITLGGGMPIVACP